MMAGVVSLPLVVAPLGCKQSRSTPAAETAPTRSNQTAGSTEETIGGADATLVPSLEDLEARLAQLASKANGKVGIAVVHVESGRRVIVGGQQWLPLQSVFKLPLAVAILKEVQGGRVHLDQVLTVKAEDRAPGVRMNQKKWAQVPRSVSVQQLLEYSLVDSDNTSSDKLLELLGGPAVLTERMQELGFQGIAVRAPTKAMASSGELPNEATAEALTNLLASLQQGDTLQPPQRDLLWGLMGRSQTGQRRIRARLPSGTAVLDKTGTGKNGTATNDVGVVTLPGGGGHLAIAVLIAASSLSTRAQEDLIAEIALAAFKEFARST